MAASSSTSTYFQGGDYVELLSAQGKAPAATWKLSGKIVKTFEKRIKGNAFLLDGSAETRMQLPKTPTSQSLGLAQRFAVFQLLIPLTKSFSIELGFSDFQKIRRRFVFASAFRDTAMTSLHVQIPFDARVTRDEWINLVFDLQALTETYFAGSTFRSMESICISGSCKLKRVFTMKDAPQCDLVHRQSHASASAAGKAPRAVPVARYADMRDIPKQFVFSSGGTGPIPTEYFVLASGTSSSAPAAGAEAMTTGSTSSASAQKGASGLARTKSASSSASGATARQRAVAKVSSTRAISGSTRASSAPVATLTPMNECESPRALMTTPSTSDAIRQSSALASRSPDRPNTASPARDARERSHEPPPARRDSNTDRPPSRAKSARSPPERKQRRTSDTLELDVSDDDARHLAHELPVTATLFASSPSPASARASVHSSNELAQLRTSDAFAAVKTSKEIHRRAIIAEIQQQLDILSDDDEHEAARNSALFLQRTSIRMPVSMLLDADSDVEERSTTVASDARRLRRMDRSLNERQETRSNGSKAGVGASVTPRTSIFSFAPEPDDSSSHEHFQLPEPGRLRATKSLFDFDSLLEPAPSSSATSQRSIRSSASLQASSSAVGTVDTGASRVGQLPTTIGQPGMPARLAPSDGDSHSDDEDDRALAELLLAKRNARREAIEQAQRSSLCASSGSALLKLSLEDLTTTTSAPANCVKEQRLENETKVESVCEVSGSTSKHGASGDATVVVTAEGARSSASLASSDVGDIDIGDDDSDDGDDLSIDLCVSRLLQTRVTSTSASIGSQCCLSDHV